MFRNYFKIAWRNLLKNRLVTIINITGLSLSISFCLLLFFYIRKEQSYDQFPDNKDKLFRFESSNMYGEADTTHHLLDFLTRGDDVDNELATPLVIGRDILQNFPQVKSVTRFQDIGDGLVKINRDIYKTSHILYADQNFFKNLSFHFISGDPNGLNGHLYNAVLSESISKKYFGSSNAIGKSFEIIGDSTRRFVVSAIVQDAPVHSSIRFDIVLSLESDPDYQTNINERFNHSAHILLIELKDGISKLDFENKINRWSKDYYVKPFVAEYGKYFKDFDFTKYNWYLRPFADCHYNVSTPWGHYTDAKNIYQLSCISLVILLIASLNYVLMFISGAAARSQEVGVRKVMGANRKSIILQFWMETQMISMISVVFGLVLARILLPLFNNTIGSELDFGNIPWKEIISASVLISIALGTLAGYYPALVISRMKPISILKNFSAFKINPRFSKILVVLQYSASVVLMISALIINRQMNFINNMDLGFNKEQVLMVTNPTWDPEFTKTARTQLGIFAKAHPFIAGFSGMNGGLNGSYNTNGFILNGEQKFRKELTVDYDYFEMLGIHFVRGRPFSRSILSDTSKKMHASVVNETLFSMLGNKAKLGEYCEPLHSRIVGVVKDYHFETLSRKIEPEEHVLAKNYEKYFMFKIRPGHIKEAIASIEKEWKSITNYPLEYTFLDETIAKMYESNIRWEKTMQASCFFAVFIACIGLFGLSAINANNRTKEVGIRKVLGATMKDITTALSSGFITMVAIAILIAIPISYWMMSRWLEDFANRIQMSWWIFAGAGCLALLIAMATVSFHAVRAGSVNPVDSLRTE
jgi:putative ABC transport system permease protein